MDESILLSVKKLLGIAEEYEQFDQDIIIDINSVFSILTQLGVGPEEGFSISGKKKTWSAFIDDPKRLAMVKTYMYLKVRMMFDPPQSGALTETMNRQISELEWRLNVGVETPSLMKKEGSEDE